MVCRRGVRMVSALSHVSIAKSIYTGLVYELRFKTLQAKDYKSLQLNSFRRIFVTIICAVPGILIIPVSWVTAW